MTTKTDGLTATIHERLCKIMEDVKAIGKDSKNTSQGFSFRGIDAVMNGLHPIFSKHGVFIAPEVLEERSEDRTTQKGAHLIYRIAKIKFHFIGAGGDEVCSTMMGEGMDSGDKAMNKAMAVALKYALTQMLLLPYDEVDADAYTHPDSVPAGKKPMEMPAESDAAEPPQAGQGEDTVFIHTLPKLGLKDKRGFFKFEDKYYSTFSASCIKELQALVGQAVEITFGPGHRADSKNIISINTDERPF